MILNDYPWLISPYQQFAEGIIHKKTHHALLINYLQGSGEDEFINMVANRLLCLSAEQLEPVQVATVVSYLCPIITQIFTS